MTSQNTFLSLPHWLRQVIDDPFQRYLCLTLIILGGILLIFPEKQQTVPTFTTKDTLHFFYHPTCPHCRLQKPFNHYLASKYPQLSVVSHDTSLQEEANLLLTMAEQMGVEQSRLSVPVTLIGPYVIVGFTDAKSSGVTIEKAISAYLEDEPALFRQEDQKWLAEERIALPWFGELQLSQFSLPILAVIIGLIDGFNPCAMWVLVYLLSLIISIRERKKIWVLVGSFVLASGILYFMFMTVWLNVFLLLGYIRPLTILIGLFAMGTGIMNIKTYITSHGSPSCSIGNASSKQRTRKRVEEIVYQPLSIATIAGIVALAFIVNSIEFACSAALPATYTHLLSLQDLSTLRYYGYIFLYVFFFMLDDLIIFSLAALAISSDTGQRYAKHTTIFSGLILLLLGLVMTFQPDLLR